LRFKGFIGAAYKLPSVNVECQRCVNLYPEMDEAGTGKEGEVAHLLSTPGLLKLLNVGLGPIRLTWVDPQQRIFVASGNNLYKMIFSGSFWSSILVGSFNTSVGIINARSNLLPNGDSVTVFVDGQDSYTFEYVSGVESFDDFTGRGYVQVDGATHVEFVDGFFVYNKPGTSQFYTSQWGEFSVDPLSFASSEGDPDNLVGLIANHRDLWLLNEKSAEVFTNTGNADFPFERVQGGFIEKGCMAAFSIAKIDGIIFWLGKDASGGGTVYAAQGLQPQRVSTHAIEQAIQSYSSDVITNATAWTYQSGGHSFYALNFIDTTWVFDLTTKLWHERSYSDDGQESRHRANTHAFVSQYGIHIVGDFENNKVYELSDTYYKDDETEIVRIRSTPHVSAGLKRVFYNNFQLDMETGVGIDGSGQGIDPQVMLTWSNDAGHTWSNEHWASAGAIGKYKKRVEWHRLGSARDRVFEVRVSDPVKVVLLGAEIEFEVGNS